MERNSRSELTQMLAASFGMDAQYSVGNMPRFDRGTGTMYCAETVVPKNMLEHALHYCEQQKERYKMLSAQDMSLSDTYLDYVIAYNAIMLLLDSIQK